MSPASKDMLPATDVFKGLSPEELKLIGEHAQEIIFPANAVIFREGEPGDKMFLIAEGVVEIWKSDGKELRGSRLARLKENEIFGEMAIFDKQPRSASAYAVINDETVNSFPCGRRIGADQSRHFSDPEDRRRTKTGHGAAKLSIQIPPSGEIRDPAGVQPLHIDANGYKLLLRLIFLWRTCCGDYHLETGQLSGRASIANSYETGSPNQVGDICRTKRVQVVKEQEF